MMAMPGPCNIDIRDRPMSQQQFTLDFAKTKPIIVRDSAKNDLIACDVVINIFLTFLTQTFHPVFSKIN